MSAELALSTTTIPYPGAVLADMEDRQSLVNDSWFHTGITMSQDDEIIFFAPKNHLKQKKKGPAESNVVLNAAREHTFPLFLEYCTIFIVQLKVVRNQILVEIGAPRSTSVTYVESQHIDGNISITCFYTG